MLKTALILVSASALFASLVAARLRPANLDEQNGKTSDLRVTVGDSRRLEIQVPLGEIVLVADDSRDLTVHAVRSTKGPLDREARGWMNDSYLTAENKDGALVVKDHPFGSDSLDKAPFHDSDKSDHRSRDLNLELQIHVPADLMARLEMTAGTAVVRGSFSSFKADIAAGTLTSDDVRCDGKMDVHMGAGELTEKLSGQDRGATNLHLGAGEVKVTLPSGASADVRAEVAMGEITGLPKSDRNENGIHFGDKRHGRAGQGDAKVDIHVGTGSIKVQGGDRLQSVAVSEDRQSRSEEEMGLDFDRSISDAIESALAQSSKALESLGSNFDLNFDGEWPSERAGGDDLGRELEKALSGVGPAIKKAMKQLKPDIEKAIHDAKRAAEQARREAKEAARKLGD